MKIEDKKTLYLLLNEYMGDLLDLDDKNVQRKKDRKKNGWNLSNCQITGVKAQFNHARCISGKLGKDIEQNMLT